MKAPYMFFNIILLMLLSITSLAADTARGQLEQDIEFLTEHGHNSGSSIEIYDKNTFKISSAAVNAYKKAVEYGSCYSTEIVVIEHGRLNDANNIKIATRDFLKPFRDFGYEQEDIQKIKETMQRLLSSSENVVTVFAGYNSRDYSESCLFHNYYIYRNDGKVLRIEFNHTD